MEKLHFKETFPYSAQDMFDAIIDAQSYKDISSMVKEIRVQDEGNIRNITTVIETPVLPMAIHYGCQLEMSPPDKIKARATKSPFKSLEGEITLKTLPNGHTEVECTLEYQTGWHPFAIAASAIMKSQIDTGIGYAKEYLAKKLTPVTSPSGPAGTPPPAP